MTTAVDVTLRIGGVFATDRPAVIRTVLGSCISVCMFDPIARVGGMNHYMLPSMDNQLDHDEPTRFGMQAMEVLIGSIQRLGGRRDRLLCKLFGGGHVLNTAESDSSVPARNIEFIERFVRDESLEVIARDLGGLLPRRVHFFPHTGKVMVKRMGEAVLAEVQLEELRYEQARRIRARANITLFEE